VIELPVHNREGQVVDKVAIDEALFGGTVRQRVLRQAILMYEAAQRVGTASTRTRAEVRGSRRKPWRQKGTGRARAGSRQSPLWRGGGVVFGPKPRDYGYRMPRKAIKAATKSAYLVRFQDGTTVIDELKAEQPRTRDMVATLAALGIERSCLIAIEAYDVNLWKSARNIPGVAMKPVAEVNAYDLLRHHRLVITRAALENLVESMRGTAPPGAEERPEPEAALAPDEDE